VRPAVRELRDVADTSPVAGRLFASELVPVSPNSNWTAKPYLKREDPTNPGSAAPIGDGLRYAAWLAGVVMIASNSIGVNPAERGLASATVVSAFDPGDDRDP